MEDLPILIIGFEHDAIRYIQRSGLERGDYRIITTVEQIIGYKQLKVHLTARCYMLDSYPDIRERLKIHEWLNEVIYV